ncbi:MAG: RNase adapter RapZ, partial [Acidaminococcaceae bacterium]|nr:RNase adapter RapZ [Acidaminococcaceae bacterium]
LPNPFYVPELKNLCGNDQQVIDYIESKDVAREFKVKLWDLVEFLLPLYVKEGKAQLMIGIGCTGGKHRSVYIANYLGSAISKKGYKAQVVHRDLTKK